MANSYSAPNFNIDADTNVAGLTALKGSAPASTNNIYIYNGARLTIESALSILKIFLGQTSSGAAGAGNRFGKITIDAGVTVTFAGNATHTNSGIQSNPSSADTSSKGCELVINGTAASRAVLTNSVGSTNTSNRWTISMNYGHVNAQYFNTNYYYVAPFAAISHDLTRLNTGNTIRHLAIGTPGQGSSPIIPTGVGNADTLHIYDDISWDASNLTTGTLYTISGVKITTGGEVRVTNFKLTEGATPLTAWAPILISGLANTSYYQGPLGRHATTDIRGVLNNPVLVG